MKNAIRPYLYGAALLAILSVGGWVWWIWADRLAKATKIENLERKVLTQTIQMEQFELANEVLRAHLERMEIENEKLDQLSKELGTMEGRDAPLSDLLRRAFGGVQ